MSTRAIPLGQATLAQIADELEERSRVTVICSECLGRGCRAWDGIGDGECPACHGSGREPWAELAELAVVLRGLLPF